MPRNAHPFLLLALVLAPTSTSAFSAATSVSTSTHARGSSPSSALPMGLLDSFFGKKEFGGSCVMGDEDIMSPKAHGTSAVPVQKDLRWDCDNQTADRICNFNRHYAEHAGYWTSTSFVGDVRDEEGEVTFYDSNTGKALFVAPRGRDMAGFLTESGKHGWPSFRDEEVVWDNVRCLGDGECVSVDGTHLGHNLPDGTGNRYCINLVSVAGRPVEGGEAN